MSDFKIFINHIENGNLKEMKKCYQRDFLDRTTDKFLRQQPIHLACGGGHLAILKFLVQKKCNIECEDFMKQRPIHYACWKGHLEIVKFLVQNKCRIECENTGKDRPIHLACEGGHLEIIKFLVQNKCSIECESNGKRQPIHVACRIGHLEIVKLFIQNKCNIECENNEKQRPIHYACRYGHLEVVKLLCESKCETDCKTEDGYTPVEIARKNENEDCENYLNEILKSRLRNIFDCVRKNDVQALGALYSSSIFKIEDYETGLLILEVAVKSQANEIINHLLNKLVNDEEISTLKHYMKNCSRPDAVQLFQECLLYRSIRLHEADEFYLYSKAKIINNHRKLIKSSFLEIAAELGCVGFIDVLLKKSIYNENEWTNAKELAIQKGHIGIAESISDRIILLKKRADKHFSWLHSAVCDNDPDMVKYILERHLVNPDFNNEIVGTALSLAHMMCYGKCIDVLENFNVDVNTQNKYSQSPLHEAIDSGMTDHCSYLISQSEDIDQPGFMGFTGLQCAVVKGFEELCDELVKNGADCVRYVEFQINQQSSINKPVLPISKYENATTLCMKIHKTIYPCFLEKLDGKIGKCSDGNGNTLLHMAVKSLQPDLCKYLIKSGSNVEAINDQGNSPIFELFSFVDNQYNNVEKAIAILNIFVESGIDFNIISKSGITVFQGASQWNSERLMVSLLSNQSQVTCVTDRDFKLAFRNHWFEYAKTLISIMTTDCLKSVITDEIFHMIMLHCDSKLLMSLFVKSSQTIQQLVIEDLLDHFALKDEYDYFLNLLNIEITRPKLFTNGETLLTSLLKQNNLKYCWAIINCATNKKCIILANVSSETPLQISIETDLLDLMIPLILNCDVESVLQFNWDNSLLSLFQKLSNSNNNDVDQKLLAAINAIIGKGGNVYKETPGGTPIINYCTRFKERIQIFQNNERLKGRGHNKICSVCLDKEVNCAFDCGHTFCKDCSEQLYRCPICNSEVFKRTKLYFN